MNLKLISCKYNTKQTLTTEEQLCIINSSLIIWFINDNLLTLLNSLKNLSESMSHLRHLISVMQTFPLTTAI